MNGPLIDVEMAGGVLDGAMMQVPTDRIGPLCSPPAWIHMPPNVLDLTSQQVAEYLEVGKHHTITDGKIAYQFEGIGEQGRRVYRYRGLTGRS